MKCPFCGNTNTKVTDSRSSEADDAIRRRRECLECGKRFTTFERLEETPITVIKKDGGREPFDREKLLNGIRRAVIKRHVSVEQTDALVSDVEAELRNQFKYEISSQRLGEMVLQRLRRLDKVAYVRFASVYGDFQDPEEFALALSKLSAAKRRARKTPGKMVNK